MQTRSAAGPLFPLLPSIPRQQWPALLQGARGGDGDFRSLAIGGWRGIYTARLPANRPWSGLNDVAISGPEWQIAWPRLLAGIEGAWTRYKADASGAVAHGPITLAGREVVVYAKRPRRKRIGQWAVDLFRPARARRAWLKTWMMFTRGLPTEIPLLLMERRSGPWVVDNIVVFERVPGPMLHDLPLDDLPERARHDLLWGLGRILRAIDAHGFTHRDAKMINWIILDPHEQPRPVMIDCDGVRHYRAPLGGLKRLLRSLSRHPQFRSQDAADVCDGYAPEGWNAAVSAACRAVVSKGTGTAD